MSPKRSIMKKNHAWRKDMDQIVIRRARLEDAKAILAIYGEYVKNTAITFEYDVPTKEAFRARMEGTLKKYPYLVAEKAGKIVGYAYAGPYYGRAAYDWCAEVTVYLARGVHGQGIGRKLYEALEEALSRMGILNLYACIAVPHGADDEYLTRNSAQFHAHLGYTLCGTFSLCGYKFGRWYDMIWMEKMIGDHRSDQPPVRRFEETDFAI